MKKKILFLFALAFWLNVNRAGAQAPQGLNYQAIARDANGRTLNNRALRIKLSVLDNITGGNLLYVELHKKQSNSSGLFTCIIGQPDSALVNSFASIDWSMGDKYLKVELDAGNNTFTDMGTVQLMSVPYALFAATFQHSGIRSLEFT